MSAPSQTARATRPLDVLRARIATTRLAGRPLPWFWSGWRGGLVALALAVAFPYVTGDQALIQSASYAGIYVLLALGLNIVVGFAGLLDLGYVAFYAIGAYTVGVLRGGLLADVNGKAHVVPVYSWWLVLPLAAVIAAFFGVLLGAPTLRLRGDYLAIVTLGFGEIVPLVFNNVPYFFGPLGLNPSPPEPTTILGFTITWSAVLDGTPYYMLTLALVVLAVLFVTSLRDSSMGRAWVAIREDETAAAASGVNLVRTKLLAFGLGALVGGIGGALYAGNGINVTFMDFPFQVSVTVVIMIVLGGIGSIAGVIVGAILYQIIYAYLLRQVDQWVHSFTFVTNANAPLHFLNGIDYNTLSNLFLGIILLLMVLYRPQGIIPNRRRQRELHGEGAAPEGASAVGLLAREEAGIAEPDEELSEESSFTGAGSDAQGREM
jgi:ABC-type branched-subunit amino acid transport system permease subunit